MIFEFQLTTDFVTTCLFNHFKRQNEIHEAMNKLQSFSHKILQGVPGNVHLTKWAHLQRSFI